MNNLYKITKSKIFIQLIITLCVLITEASAENYIFKPSSKLEDLDSIRFINGVVMQKTKSGEIFGRKIKFYDQNKKEIIGMEISNDISSIIAAYPNKENSQVVFVSSQCSGNGPMCATPTIHAVYVYENKIIINDFEPALKKYSISINIKNKKTPEFILNNLVGFDYYDEYGDAKYFKYKFIEEKGFLRDEFKSEFYKLVGIHPSEYLSNKVYRTSILDAIGVDEFREFRDYIGVASVSKVILGKYIVFSGCMPHSCNNMGTIVIDATNNGIWVIWGDSDKALIKFKSNIPWNENVLNVFLSESDFFQNYSKSKKYQEKFIDQIKSSIAQEKNSIKIKNNELKEEKLDLSITTSLPDTDGVVKILIKTSNNVVSVKIDNEEITTDDLGLYVAKRLPKFGNKTIYNIVAVDKNGNKLTRSISLERKIIEKKENKEELNPAKIVMHTHKDAVAIIIGIADYKNLPRADYANDDARSFYDYAIRGLGVRTENIKLLIDAEADEIEILRAFKNWLPAHVKETTDIYLYYSGHGLPTNDGTDSYLLPQRADRDFLNETALQQEKINQLIKSTKPKSVTIFLDSCYSGMARTGQTLIASARPISLKSNTHTFPPDFTVFTASTADQISSSSPDLKHGIFSYYLMKGMEGDADTNKDGKITTGEMHGYLIDNVTKQASLYNRVQRPQLTGDASRVLVGK